MKIAATVILFVATLFVVDGVTSRVSVGETIQSDFLNVDAPAEKNVEEGKDEVIEDWIDTVRRKRTRRQSRFC